MSYKKVSGVVAAAATALALTASAHGETGKSPNGAPGPAGNPNPPAAQPQANGPQGPAGNNGNTAAAKSHGKSQSHGKSNASHGKSQAQSHGKSQPQSHGKSQAQSHGNSNSSHGKSQSKPHPTQSHANPNPGTPRKGGREDRPAGKITICHATKSQSNPYVKITISVNGLHGHGPADDSRHHEGSWQDIIPAPEGDCPSTVQEQTTENKTEEQPTTTTTAEVAKFVAPAPEVAATAPATEAAPAQAVLGVQAAGGNAPAEETDTPGASKVLGASASGNTAPKAAVAARAETDSDGSLPFTGFGLVVLLIAAAAALLGGFALRRATAGSNS